MPGQYVSEQVVIDRLGQGFVTVRLNGRADGFRSERRRPHFYSALLSIQLLQTAFTFDSLHLTH